jgi:predicted Zn-dependent protease
VNPAELLAEAERVAQRARRRGAQDAEAYVWRTREVEASVVGRLPAGRVAEATGVGLRVVAEGRLGHASCSLGAGVERAIASALADARRAPSPGQLPEAQRGAGPAGPWDARVSDASLADVARAAQDIAAGMRAPDARFATAVVQHQAFAFAVASTRGVQVAERGTAHRVSAECRVERGAEQRTGTLQRAARTLLDLRGAGEACVARARASLGAQALPAGPRAVLLDPATSGALFQLLGPALAQEEAEAGRSFLPGPLGSAVAAPALTVRDAPSLGGLRAQAWDDEGTPTRDRVLLDRGALRARLGAGNRLRAQEERHRAPPVVAPLALAPEPGTKPFEALVAEADDAVVVRHGIMGSSHVNAATGSFSLVAPSAWLVRRGAVEHPLRPVTLAGTAPEALHGIVTLSRDTETGPAGVTPGVVLTGLVCAS